MKLGKIVKTLRTALKWSQQELAQNAGLSQQLIAKIESGRITETRKLPQLAAAFGMTVDQLLACIREPGELMKDGTVMVPLVPPHTSRVHLTPDEQRLLLAFRTTNRAGKQAILGAASGVLERQVSSVRSDLDIAIDALLKNDPSAAREILTAAHRKLVDPDEEQPSEEEIQRHKTAERFGHEKDIIQALTSAGKSAPGKGKTTSEAKDRAQKKPRNEA